VIIDLTADQLPSLKDRPVICSAYADLFRDGIDYAPQENPTAAELAADPVRERLAVLEAAMS